MHIELSAFWFYSFGYTPSLPLFIVTLCCHVFGIRLFRRLLKGKETNWYSEMVNNIVFFNYLQVLRAIAYPVEQKKVRGNCQRLLEYFNDVAQNSMRTFYLFFFRFWTLSWPPVLILSKYCLLLAWNYLIGFRKRRHRDICWRRFNWNLSIILNWNFMVLLRPNQIYRRVGIFFLLRRFINFLIALGNRYNVLWTLVGTIIFF